MATQKGSGLMSRAVREALGTLVSPQLCEQLITRSLAAHNLSNIPESGSEIGEWLEGGLRAEVESTVGSDAADLMLTQLGPIAAYAAISKPRATAVTPAAKPEPARPISSFPAQSMLTAPPGVAVSTKPLSEQAAELAYLDDEPDRPTNLRLDPGQEPDWRPQPAAARPAYDSSPLTLRADAPGEVAITPMPPANSNAPAEAFRSAPPFADPIQRRVPMRAKPGLPRETMVSEATADIAVVLVATSEHGDVAALQRYLSTSAHVLHVVDLAGLLDALEDPIVSEPIVLIDCQRPTVHVTSVAALGEDLPQGTTVVLWGADDTTWSQIDRERSPSCRWVRCSREATPDDVGSLCSMLIG